MQITKLINNVKLLLEVVEAPRLDCGGDIEVLRGERRQCFDAKKAIQEILYKDKNEPEAYMNNLHIAASPLTGTIFAGKVLKDGRTWGAGKKDVTIEALVAVAEHTLKFGEPVEISQADGTPKYRITVDRL